MLLRPEQAPERQGPQVELSTAQEQRVPSSCSCGLTTPSSMQPSLSPPTQHVQMVPICTGSTVCVGQRGTSGFLHPIFSTVDVLVKEDALYRNSSACTAAGIRAAFERWLFLFYSVFNHFSMFQCYCCKHYFITYLNLESVSPYCLMSENIFLALDCLLAF